MPCDSTCARCETISTHCTQCSYTKNREMTPSSNKCICREEFIEDSEGNCIWLGEGDFSSTKTAVKAATIAALVTFLPILIMGSPMILF
jgi:hypothetical protein